MKNTKETVNIKHPFRDYDTKDAMDLATTLNSPPFCSPIDKVVPTLDEAIKLLENYPTMKSCNWITGQTAVQVLKASKGEKVDWT